MIKHTVATTAPRASLAMGAVGAVVGGIVAGAKNYDKVKSGEVSREAAVRDVIKETGATGLATGTGAAVMGAIGATGLLSLAGMVLVAAGTKHLADKMLASSPCCAEPAAECAPAEEAPAEEPAEKKTAAKKTAKKTKTSSK